MKGMFYATKGTPLNSIDLCNSPVMNFPVRAIVTLIYIFELKAVTYMAKNDALEELEEKEWNAAESIAAEMAQEKKNYAGLMKIDRKETGLDHSFMAVVENGKVVDLFKMSRKKLVSVEGEGIIGKGAFGVVADSHFRGGLAVATKYQAGENDIEVEMKLLKAADWLYAQGFLTNKKGEKRHYAFMKREQGDELFKNIYIQQGDSYGRREIPRKEQLLLATKCLQGVKYLHHRNIVHRDIKPENFMARFGDEQHKDIIILSPIDLGLAHQLNPGEKYRVLDIESGTPGYMAPEVRRGILSKANDIYSLGIMFRHDFGMKDEFIDRMLQEYPANRPTIDQCLDYFKKTLLSELKKEAAEKKSISGTKEHFDQFFPGFWKYKDNTKKELARLLGDKEELLKELENKLPNGPDKEKIEVHRKQKPTNDESVKAILQDGFNLMVEIISKVDREKLLDLPKKVKLFGERLKRVFFDKDKSKFPTYEEPSPPSKKKSY